MDEMKSKTNNIQLRGTRFMNSFANNICTSRHEYGHMDIWTPKLTMVVDMRIDIRNLKHSSTIIFFPFKLFFLVCTF